MHGLHDLALKCTHFPAIPLDVVQVRLLMIYGIYLLRADGIIPKHKFTIQTATSMIRR
jgi:hypothetical protein